MEEWGKKQARLVAGKVRRFLFVRLRKGYVSEQLSLRQGDCNHCGNCCEILFKCPFLIKQHDGQSFCSIYDDRPGQCGAFPIDNRCLSDVDFDCTYSFVAETAEEPELIQISAATTAAN